MWKKLTHAVYEDGTGELNRIVSREYPEKERLPLPPPIIGHSIQCQYIPGSRCKCIHTRIHKKIRQHISKHIQIPFRNIDIIILQKKLS